MKKLLSAAVVASMLFCNISTVFAQGGNDETVEPQAIQYEWRYKEINGKWYKRKYDIVNHAWVGPWILIL